MKSYQHTIYASYLGYITQAIVNNLAPLLFLILRAEYGFSLMQITLIPTLNFAVQLLVDLVSAKYMDKIGYRAGILAAHVFAAAGLIGIAVLPDLFGSAFSIAGNAAAQGSLLSPTYTGFLIAVVLYAIGGGIIEVLISPIVEACPTDNKVAAMSLLHSFYCWGTLAVVLFSTLFLFAFGKESWRILACLWALIPIGNFFYFTQVPIFQLVQENEGMTAGELARNSMFWLLFIMMITAGASEIAMSSWASAFAESELHVPKAVGDIAGPCMFAALMGCARAYFGKKGEPDNILTLIRGGAILCVLAYLLVIFAPMPALSFVGLGLTGLSVAFMWPGTFSLASRQMPKGGTVMFALLALAGDVGCSSGPTVVGWISGLFGENLRAGLLAAVLFPVLLILCTLKVNRT